jgi:hypothetical protein
LGVPYPEEGVRSVDTCIKPRLLKGVYLLDGNQCGVAEASRREKKLKKKKKFKNYYPETPTEIPDRNF